MIIVIVSVTIGAILFPFILESLIRRIHDGKSTTLPCMLMIGVFLLIEICVFYYFLYMR